MKKRHRDKRGSYNTFSTMMQQKVCVSCPKCSNMGIVTADWTYAYYQCNSCNEHRHKRLVSTIYAAKGQCQHCKRFFNKPLPEDKNSFTVLNVDCPHCGLLTPSKVLNTNRKSSRYYDPRVKDNIEPYFGFELYFSTYFRGKPVWAYHREHLQFIIDYIEAELRERPLNYIGGKTLAYSLPKYMKLSKNRNAILKVLKWLQEK